MSRFKKAVKYDAKLNLAFIGPAGSGKTYSALAVGCEIARLTGARVALIDTERNTASLYADLFEFDTLALETFSPLAYVEAIKEAEREGYGVIIVDSLSHAWVGKEGALEQRDRFAKREQNNSFAAWRHVTPMHNLMVDALVSSPAHLVATMRTKTEYVIETDERTGKSKPRKIGLAPVQRDGLEYEFSVVGDLDNDNGFTVTKTRCPLLTGGYIEKPGAQLAQTLVGWLRGAERPPAPPRSPIDIERDAILVLVEAAEDEQSLRDLVPQIRQLPDPPLSQVRAAYEKRLYAIRAQQPNPDHRPTEDIPRESATEAAKRALQGALRQGDSEKAG